MDAKEIFVAIPNTGYIHKALAEWMVHCEARKDYHITWFLPVDFPVDVNRNNIVNSFLKNKTCDWLLMVDSDLIPPTYVLDMIPQLEKEDIKICSALTHMQKGDEVFPTVFKEKGKGFEYKIESGINYADINQVAVVGTGCLWIHREVVEKLEKPLFQFKYYPDGTRAQGEDISFCAKAEEAGYKTYVDPRVGCIHFVERAISAKNAKY